MRSPLPAPCTTAVERWLSLALAAGCIATLFMYRVAGLGNLRAGGEVARFWLIVFGISYLPFAAAGALVERWISRNAHARWPTRLLRAAAVGAFLATAFGLNRQTARELVTANAGPGGATALGFSVLAALSALVAAPAWQWVRRGALCAALVGTILAAHGYSPGPRIEPPPQDAAQPTGERLLLVGIDGADPLLVDQLLADGDLPRLGALRERGISGPLATLLPTSSPRIWTTMITGRSPSVHGVQGHMFERPRWILERAPETGEQLRGFGLRSIRDLLLRFGILVRSPATSQERRVPALWNLSTHFRQPLSLVGWWATWPAEPILGRISSDRLNYFRWQARGATDLDRRRVTFPEGLHAQIRRLVVSPVDITYAQARRFLDVDEEQFDADRAREYSHHEVRSEFRYYYSQFLTDRAVANYFLAADQAAGREPMDLLVLFRLVDQTSHCCLQFSELVGGHTAGSGREQTAFRRVVREAYRTADETLGELIDSFGPGNVIVVSDHGFESTLDEGLLSYNHRSAPPGIFVAAGPAFREGHVEGLSVSDIMPILLYLKGLPISDEIERPLRRDLFSAEFAAATPVLHVRRYGELQTKAPLARETSADKALFEELKALGYIQ